MGMFCPPVTLGDITLRHDCDAGHCMTVSENQIAIIDDDPSVCRALGRLLRSSSSFHVRTYSSASEFIDSLELQVPDCLTTDLQMPEMSGEELLRFLADTGFRIPTVILTAHDQDGTQERCRQAGATGFLVKPVSVDELLGTIEHSILDGLGHPLRAVGGDW